MKIELLDPKDGQMIMHWKNLMHNVGFSRFHLSENEYVFLWNDNDFFAGTVTLDLYKDCGIIKQVAVHTDFRKQGLGRDIIIFSINFFKEHKMNYSALCCYYWLFNFYKKFGFEVTPRRKLPFHIRTYSQFSDKRYMSCSVMLLSLKRKRRKQENDRNKILEAITDIAI